MNTCRTCKFYSVVQTTLTEKYEEGECSCPKFRYVHDVRTLANDELGYWDYEGYLAGVNVGPNFGCIHWEAKAK